MQDAKLASGGDGRDNIGTLGANGRGGAGVSLIGDQIRARFLPGGAAIAKTGVLEEEVRSGAKPPSVAAGEAASLIVGHS